MPQHMFIIENFSTPPKLFYLPLYVGGLAQVLLNASSVILLHSQLFNARILAFVQFAAKQGKDSEVSCSPNL